jgi:hypothetical protein
MASKEDRKKRKQDRIAKRHEKSKVLVASYAEDGLNLTPRFNVIPNVEKIPSIDANLGNLIVPKQPKTNSNGSRFGYKMSWCARIADQKGTWEWGEDRQWCGDEWHNLLLKNMNNLEELDWSEIQNMSSDSGHLMHHEHDVTDLCDHAIERWLELDLEQFDTTFRFRLGNTKRAWGIVLGGHFCLVWFERFHKIYSV